MTENAHLRRGPSPQSETIGGLSSGMCLTILGRNAQSSWVYILSDEDSSGWVSVENLMDSQGIDRVSVREDFLPVTVARPTLTSAEIAHGARQYLTQVASTSGGESSMTRYVEPCFETVERIGDGIQCRVERAYCDYLPELDGNMTICSDRPAPDHIFTLLVPGEDWSEYDGQCLIVEGQLGIQGGALQIQAVRRAQVSKCN